MYIRFCSPMIVFFAVGGVPMMLSGVLGHQGSFPVWNSCDPCLVGNCIFLRCLSWAHPVKSRMDNAILDIKVFDDADSIEVLVRSMGAPYNPLDFDVDSESFSKIGVKLAQKVTERIIYTNVYKMNIISIVVKK